MSAVDWLQAAREGKLTQTQSDALYATLGDITTLQNDINTRLNQTR